MYPLDESNTYFEYDEIKGAPLFRSIQSMNAWLLGAGYVPLPVIVKKVVSDHAASSLGEFRHVILAMLETYSYDTAIHRSVQKTREADVRPTISSPFDSHAV